MPSWSAVDEDLWRREMSVMFGQWYFDGRPLLPVRFEEIGKLLSQYGPHGMSQHTDRGVHILCGELRTTREAKSQVQPLLRSDGAAIVWDGRLDNREDLLRQINRPLPKG